ncbi:MAG: C4-dicarboxylate transport system (Permease small protein) [candidate division TA06 bacterium 34_109]|uniref:C4-dicarboxylate transport system (Permease small protein) n=1 Tax=candidate division TA06 bacterium 34_109 TaxID=1635277 RepID=A0A117M623_UNCT6|nr:MAG: C4-dicarboxylate transport system (Permease small protein) [candidate division TA06 bacterium 34_109]
MGDILENFLEKIIGLLTGVMVLLLIAQVATRYIFRGSIYWAGEMSVWVFIWITYLGAALLYKRKNLIIVKLLDFILPEKIKKVLEIFVDVIVALFLAVIFYYSIPVVKAYSNQYATSVYISRSLMFLSLPISFTLIFLFMIDNFLQKIRGK